MIQANISEIKNRLSYYLKLVKGGEQVEILDRKTPLARIIHVSQSQSRAEKTTSWIQEVKDLGLVNPPDLERFDPELMEKDRLPGFGVQKESGVLEALLEEREGGR